MLFFLLQRQYILILPSLYVEEGEDQILILQTAYLFFETQDKKSLEAILPGSILETH